MKKTAEIAVPFDRLNNWLAEAEKSELNDPSAVALATVGENGAPSLRMVLMKGCDERGLVFYTNLGSKKAQELEKNTSASMLFHWKSLRRQVRIEGNIVRTGGDEADTYFASRARSSQIGAWASKQSQPMEGRFEFEAAIAKYTAKFGTGAISRPDFWSGFRLEPTYFEFWQDRRFRLHERITYSLDKQSQNWLLAEIYP